MLENFPDNEKNWHPRSTKQVLDLVHPSLYCIVYKHTIAREGYMAQVCCPSPESPSGSDPDGGYAAAFLSEDFSWLPTNFSISPNGKAAKALAYINNLSPWKHAALYPVIEQIVACFVPMWERVLGENKIGAEFHLPQRVPDSSYY